jgi:hypothetical protein
MNYIDSAALFTLKNSKYARFVGYKSAMVSTAALAPFALQLFCIVYNKIMNNTSKEAINTLFKEDIMLSQFHSKYEMLTVMCQEETINPMDFINQHKQMVDPVLQQLGIDIQSTQTEDLFKEAINNNIQSILNYIKSKKETIYTIFNTLKIKGGKTKHYGKKRKQTKRKKTKTNPIIIK